MVDVPNSKLTAAGARTGDEIVMISQLSTSVRISATTISALAADNSFNDSANGFIAAGFAVGNYVHVTGFTGNAVNNIYSAKITALTAGKMTIGGTDGDVIVDDAAGETVVISKWVPRRDVLPRVLLNETVTAGSATNVSFTNIPAVFRDLEVRIRGRGTKPAAVNVDIRMRFNNDSGANYDSESLQGSGATPVAFGSLAQTSAYVGNLAAATAPANVGDAIIIAIPDYRGTIFQKVALYRATLKAGTSVVANLFTEAGSNFWRSTAAINRVDIFPSANAFVDGTVVSLYGLI